MTHPGTTRRRGARRTLTLAALLLCALTTADLALAQDPDASAEAPRYELVYEGELLDQDRKPVSGVFPLTFKLYPNERAQRALWREAHFVSVIDGHYRILLGTRTPLPPQAAEDTLVLGVDLDGREILRQPLRSRATAARAGLPLAAATGSCEYCETCGDASTLDGHAASDFAPAEVVLNLERHIKDQSLHGGGGDAGGGISGTRPGRGPNVETRAAGGSGGQAFSLTCPDGFVVTGIKGRAGAVIDSFQVICTKLE